MVGLIVPDSGLSRDVQYTDTAARPSLTIPVLGVIAPRERFEC